MLLVSDIFSDLFFIKAYCTDAVAACPKGTSSHHSDTFASKTHHLGCTLSFQKADGMRYSILGRNRNTKVNMIRHRVPFYNLNSLDSSPLLDRIDDDLSLGPIKLFSAILGDPNDMVLTIPN